MTTIFIRGIELDLNAVDNPKLKKVLRRRQREFIFNYGDEGNKYSESIHHKDSGGYTEHTDRNWNEYGDYSERGTHSDVTRGARDSSDKHTDYTDRTNHTDYDDYREEWYDGFDHDDSSAPSKYNDSHTPIRG